MAKIKLTTIVKNRKHFKPTTTPSLWNIPENVATQGKLH
jgi:hypothetical protein